MYQKVSQVISIILCTIIDNDKEWKLLCIPYIEFIEIEEKLQYVKMRNTKYYTNILISYLSKYTKYYTNILICALDKI